MIYPVITDVFVEISDAPPGGTKTTPGMLPNHLHNQS